MIAIELDRESDTPLYRQIASQVRGAVASGALAENERLPTTRSLAVQLGVNRLTVSRAYADLAGEGILSPHVGRGTFAGAVRPGTTAAPAPQRSGVSLNWSSLFARNSERAVEHALPAAAFGAAAAGTISFASLFPDPSLFPVEPFRRALDGVVRREGHRVLGYGPPGGYPPLKKLIAASLKSRGINVDDSEIMITNGSQQGIDLVARALLDPGDVVLVENPTYTGAVQVFHSYGAELVGVPVDEQGAIVSQLEEAVARHRPKLIYLMPNFQNPTSETMSLPRRRALMEIAGVHRVAILEDDFGGDLRFDGPDLPSLKVLDRSQGVIYLSTFAKKLLPGLRIGWIAAPAAMVERLLHLKKITDYSTSLLLQAGLHEFCRQGGLDRHLLNVVEKYRERRDAMVAAMKRSFPAEVTFSRPKGGLVVWVTLPPGVDADEIAEKAAAASVLIGRGDLFYLDGGGRQNLRLTFGQTGIREIHRGIRILGEIIGQAIRARRGERRTAPAESLPLI